MIKQKHVVLEGFNNLTKTLSFNLYDICYAPSRQAQDAYIEYIDETFNAERLTSILTDVTEIIGAQILNIARYDYDPQGASVTMLIAEGGDRLADNNQEAPGPLPESVVGALDKSHVTVHTYPERHPVEGISTFRADIDVSTCGEISPLKALNLLIHSFESDIVTIDYRVRGFTRDVDGTKHFIDHDIHSIQNYIDPETLELYEAVDFNLHRENIFLTKLRRQSLNLDDYLFSVSSADLDEESREAIFNLLEVEMTEIFLGANLP